MLVDWIDCFYKVGEESPETDRKLCWVLLGIAFDYPDCCIEFFCEVWAPTRLSEKDLDEHATRVLQLKRCGKLDRIPCPSCLEAMR